jgi:RHS repeat-associated protein
MLLPQQIPLCHYRYDSLDLLISHTEPQVTPRQRFYCKSRLATEIQGTLHHSFIQHDDLVLAQQQRQDDVLDTTLLATDLQRSILHTLKANQQRDYITYLPYGHRHAVNRRLSLLGFNGERPDSVTGNYLLGNGYRAFNPVLMRFNRPDSWSPFGKGGLNSYAYCFGDPVNFVDPTGHVLDGVLKGIRKLVRWVAKPVPRNDPALNSLEGINSDVFNEIAKFLGQKDMDNLALVSKRLNEYSVEASKSNLQVFIRAEQKANRKIYPSLNDYNCLPVSGGFRFRPPVKGVGSAAFKMLDPSIMGNESLSRHVKRVRESVIDDLDLRTTQIEGGYLYDVNFHHSERILSSLRRY